MAVALTVHVHQLRLHGFHGLYEGEETVGNEFELNLDIWYTAKKDQLTQINHLIDYEAVTHLVRKRMEIPTPILEELAYSISQKIKHTWPQVEKIKLSIYKLNAAITQFQGRVGVTVSREFER